MFTPLLLPLALVFGYFIDYLLGDPQIPYHPIRFIGWLINIQLGIYDKLNIRRNTVRFIYGLCMVLITISITYCISLSFILLVDNDIIRLILETIMVYFLISARQLFIEGARIIQHLKRSDISAARLALSYIVGRDTDNLDEDAIIRATVETISENLSDGVIAPLFYLWIGGLPLAFLYKAVNTLDSMVGYKNERFMHLGMFAAKLDDVLNFIPARLSALLMLISTFILKLDFKNAYRVYLSDRYNHSSPNSGHTEAVCAGALGIRLGGISYYNGVEVIKPTIGFNKNLPTINSILMSCRIMYLSSSIFVAIILFAWFI